MKETVKLRLMEELEKRLFSLYTKFFEINRSYIDWEEWKKDKIEISCEELNLIGNTIAETLTELKAVDEPFWIKAWWYHAPVCAKQLKEMLDDKGAGQCGNPLPLADASATRKSIPSKVYMGES